MIRRQPYVRLRRLLLWLAAIVGAACGHRSTTASQFVLLQASYWVPEGAESTAVPTSLALLFLSSDSGSPVARLRAFSFDPYPFHPLRAGEWTELVIIERDAHGRFRRVQTEWLGIPVRSIYNSRPDIGLPAGDVPSLLAQAGAWLGALYPGPDGVWRDTVEHTLAFPDDTVSFWRVRDGRRVDEGPPGGTGPWWMQARGSLQIKRRLWIEYPIERGGVRVQVDLTGPVTESFLYRPERYEADSIHTEGTLAGTVVFEHRTRGERRDTVAGRWTFVQMGVWTEEVDSVHLWPEELDGLSVDSLLGRRRTATPFDRAVIELLVLLRPDELDRLSVDSLLARRRRATTPFSRLAIEGVLDSLVRASPNDAAVQRAAEHDPYAAVALLDATLKQPARGHRMTAAEARPLAAALELTMMRRRLAPRASLLADALSLLEYADEVTPDAGPVLADAARHADDAYARDILLLGAYRADPPRFRAMLEHLADTTMYGRVAREYVHGNDRGTALHSGLGPLRDDTTWHWGLDLRDSSRGARFPGVDAPVARLRAYLDYGGKVAGRTDERSAPPVREWLASHSADGQQILQRRFATEPDTEPRLTLARLLLLLDDSIALAWLEATVERASEAYAVRALDLLSPRRSWWDAPRPWPPDDWPDARARRSAMQDLVLRHVYGDGGLMDLQGAPVPPPTPYDAIVVVAEELVPDATGRWAKRVRLVSDDSIKYEGSGPQRVLRVNVPQRAGRGCVVEYATGTRESDKSSRQWKSTRLVLDRCQAGARLVRQLPGN